MTIAAQLDEESIAEGLDSESENSRTRTRPASRDEASDENFDFQSKKKHRSFRTQTPDGKDVEELHEETTTKKPSRLQRYVFLFIGFVVFIAVIVGGLYLYLSGNRNQIQVGTSNQRPGDQRAQDENARQAQAALKAVTESAVAPPPVAGARQPGDISAPVAPDPLSNGPYAPNAVSPYGTQPAPDASTQPATTPQGSPSSGVDQSSPGSTTTAGRSTPERTTNNTQGISYYFFRRAAALEPTQTPDDSLPPSSPQSSAPDMAGTSAPSSPQAAPVKPPFGATLPVRLLDSVATLREGGVVRLETTRAVGGPGGWKIPRGTTVVARLAGGNNDRAFMNVIGFIDTQTNRLVNVGGEVKGTDGAQGLRGQRKRVNSLWISGIKQAANATVSLGSAFLLGRRGGSGGYYPPTNLGEQAGLRTQPNANIDFIYVPAGAQAFVMITDLPASVEGSDASTLNSTSDLTDEELTRLVTEGTPAQIRAALPRMNPELRRIAEQVLAQEQQGEGVK